MPNPAGTLHRLTTHSNFPALCELGIDELMVAGQ
jgi:hypothetical protein